MDALFSTWIDCRQIFRAHYGPTLNANIETMLQAFELKFEGRAHCGLADTRNLARVVLKMLSIGCSFPITNGTTNEMLFQSPINQIVCLSLVTNFLYGIYGVPTDKRKGSRLVWKEDAIFQAVTREIKSINKVLLCDKRFNPQATHNRYQVYILRGGIEGIRSIVKQLPSNNSHLSSEVICTVHTTKKSTLVMSLSKTKVIGEDLTSRNKNSAAESDSWDGHVLTNDHLMEISPAKKLVSFKKVSLRAKCLTDICA